MKRILNWLIVLGCLFSLTETKAQTIRLRIPDSTVLVGSSLWMPVYADSSFTGLGVISYQVQLSFNAAYLMADSLAVAGTLSAGTTAFGNFATAGQATIGMATSTPISGSGVLFYVRFRPVTSYGGYAVNIGFGPAGTSYLNQGSPSLTFAAGTLTVPSLPVISITPGTGNLILGDSLTFSATGGRQPYSWRLSDTTAGTIRSLTAGTARYFPARNVPVRVIAVDSNGFSGQTHGDINAYTFRMFTRDTTRFQGTQVLFPVYVSNLTPYQVVSGTFSFNIGNSAYFRFLGLETAGTLLAGTPQVAVSEGSGTSFNVSFANSTPVTGEGVLCYLRIELLVVGNFASGHSIALSGVLFNQQHTALVSSGNLYGDPLPQLNLTPNTAELLAGQSLQMQVGNGFPPYQWSVSDTSKADISSAGLLFAKQGGVVQVTVNDSLGATRTSGNIQLYDTRLFIADTVAIAGDTLVEVAVRMGPLPMGKTVTALNMTFDFDATRLDPIGVVQTGTLTQGWSQAVNRLANNRYTLALAGSNAQGQAGTLFYLRFRILPAFAANEGLNLLNVQFNFNEGNPNVKLENGIIRVLPCNPGAVVSPAGQVTFCANQPTALNGPFGTAYQYQWFRNGSLLPGANDRVYTPAQSGKYTLKVALNSSCFVVSDTIQVTVNPSPMAQIAPYADTLRACTGDTIVLSTYREAGYSLQWFLNGSPLSGATDSVYKATSGGAYTVRATANGCQTTSAVQQLFFRPLPVKPVITVTGSPICVGDSATLRIPASGQLYQWYSAASGMLAGATDTFVRVPAGKYVLKLTDASGCSILSDSVTVAAATASAVIDPFGPTTFCQGGSVTLDLTQATNYVRWFRNGIQLSDTVRPVTVNQTGSYTAVYRLTGNACMFTTPAVSVTVNPRPVVTFDSLTAVCVGSPPFVLTQGLPAGGTYVGPGVVGNQFVPASLSPGTYTLKYGVQVNGCSDTASRTIVVNALPGTALSVLNPVCINTSPLTLTGGTPAGGTYFGTGVTAGVFNPATAGTGTFSIGYTTQNAQGCRDTAFRSITVNALPPASISQGATAAYCQGGSVALNANTGTGLSYQWLRNNVPLSGAVQATLNAVLAGNYRVLVTNAGGCSDTSTVTVVTENPRPAALITPAGATTFCQGGTVQLNANTGAGLTYRWLLNGAPVSGQTAASLTAGNGGNYQVIVTNATNCFDTATAITVTVNPKPLATITATGSTALCSGDSVILNAATGVGFTYQWLLNNSVLTGQTNATLTANVAGAYRVLITNAAGCSDTSAVTAVTVNTPPVASITPAGATTFCAGDNVTLNAGTGAGLTYVWLRNGTVVTGQTSASLLVTQAGDYRVRITNASGCSDTSAVVTITVNPAPDAPVLSINVDTIFSSVSTGLSWFRNGLLLTGISDSFIVITQNGTYRAITVGSNGCGSDSSNAIVVGNVSVASLQQQLILRVYPNPSDGLFMVEYPEAVSGLTLLRISDMQGRLIRELEAHPQTGLQHFEVDLSAQTAGVYLLEIRQGQQSGRQRIIVSR